MRTCNLHMGLVCVESRGRALYPLCETCERRTIYLRVFAEGGRLRESHGKKNTTYLRRLLANATVERRRDLLVSWSEILWTVRIEADMQSQPMHEALKPLAWLEGTWRVENTGEGKFPTIKSFNFCEEIQFSSIGQPMLNYTGQSWHPEKKRPMHREVGFLKIIPGTNKVSLVLAHNFGLATIEEGQLNVNEVKLKSTSVARMSEGCKDPAVLRIEREFRLVGTHLEQVVRMATTSVSETKEHLRTVYQKVEG